MRKILIALCIASALVRTVYFVQLNSTPLLHLERWDQSDMNAYDAWGRAIAGGYWLSATVGVPMHAWHYQVATEYFATHPQDKRLRGLRCRTTCRCRYTAPPLRKYCRCS